MQIAWQDDNTLKVETDAGMQTRLLPLRHAWRARNVTAPVPPGRADVAGHISRAMGRRRRGDRRQQDSARPRCARRHRQPHARSDDHAHPSGVSAKERRSLQRRAPPSRSTSISSKIPTAWTGSSSRRSSAIRSTSMAPWVTTSHFKKEPTARSGSRRRARSARSFQLPTAELPTPNHSPNAQRPTKTSFGGWGLGVGWPLEFGSWASAMPVARA